MALRERDEAVTEAKRRSSEAIAAAQEDKDAAIAEAHRLRDLAQERLKFETERLGSIANEANGSIQGVTRAMEEARSAERMARREADRAVGEMTQLREKLENVRAEFSQRLKEYMLQVGDLERGAQVLATDPNADHVLRPSQLYEAAQTLALDLHRASADQVTEYRRVTEDLQQRLTRAQRDVRALHAGYRTLRHRFEDVAPETVDEKGKAAVPHEDDLVGTPPTPAEAREMDARGLAQKLADLRDENAALQKELRMAALDGRGPLAPHNVRAAKEAAARGGGSRPGTGGWGDCLLQRRQQAGPRRRLWTGWQGRDRRQEERGRFVRQGDGRPGENARLRAENVRLQKTIDELNTDAEHTEEDMGEVSSSGSSFTRCPTRTTPARSSRRRSPCSDSAQERTGSSGAPEPLAASSKQQRRRSRSSRTGSSQSWRRRTRQTRAAGRG